MPLPLLPPLLILGTISLTALPYILYRRHYTPSPPQTPTSPMIPRPESTTSTLSTSTFSSTLITPPLSPGEEESIIWTSSAHARSRSGVGGYGSSVGSSHRRNGSGGGDSGFCDGGGDEGGGERGGGGRSWGRERNCDDDGRGRGRMELRLRRRRRSMVGGGEDDDGEEFVRFGKAATWLRDKVGIN